MSDAADLRSLLRAADQSRQSIADYRSSRQPDPSLHELASLIGAIEQDEERKRGKGPPSFAGTAPPPAASGTASNAGFGTRYKEILPDTLDFPRAAAFGDDFLSESDLDAPPDRAKTAESDTFDHTCVRFQTQYVLRGKNGKYLTASLEDAIQPHENMDANANARPAAASQKVYLLGVEGFGVGDTADALTFVNIENKDDLSGMKYGQVVSLKSSFAKERLLGLRDGVKLGFWRHLIGQGEKWQILKANTAHTPSTGPLGLSNYMGVEDVSARGKYVRIGDTLLIQTFKADHFLSVHETEPRLIYRERAAMGGELWQIELFGTVPLPMWCQNRPYLSGSYLLTPPQQRAPAPEVEARAFPRSMTAAGFLEQPIPKSLDHFSLPVQQHVLMREVLLVLSGVEGQYIRIAVVNPPAAATSQPASGGETTFGKEKYDNRKMVSVAYTQTALPRIQDVKLVIDLDSADRSTAAKIQQLFPLCESVARIREFIRQHSRYEYGLTSHALCSVIQDILKDFHVLLTQLEHLLNTGKLTLQKLAFLLHPSSHILYVLDVLCTEIGESVGGQLLNKMYTLYLQQGDTKTKELYQRLLSQTAQPFLRMLALWIFRGELQDVYKEFMVSEDQTVSKEALLEDFNASYWDQKYGVANQHIPAWMASHAQRILVVGKYLNVVRDCVGESALSLSLQPDATLSGGNASRSRLALTAAEHGQTRQEGSKSREVEREEGEDSEDEDGGRNEQRSEGELGIHLPAPEELLLDLEHNGTATLQAVDRSYSISSQSLLHVLINKYRLYDHIASLHKYFLLKHGDFFIQFMDIAEAELRKDVKDILLSKLQYLLLHAIQSSTLSSDEHKDRLSCSLASHNLIQHLHLIQIAGETGSAASDAYRTMTSHGLKGVESFTLEYVVNFPLSIVLSRRVITKYQLLSRLLYFGKHVERRVLAAWMGQQASRECAGVRAVLGTAYTLRHRMLHFMQNFVYYITFEVIHPREHDLWQELRAAKDMDQVMDLHEKFLDGCLKECLLASQELLKILTKIMTTCLLFAEHTIRFMDEAVATSANSAEPAAQSRLVLADRSSRPGGGGLKSTSSFRKAPPSPHDQHMAKVSAKLNSILEKRRQRVSANAEHIQHEAGHESFVRIISKFSEAFDTQLKEFLDNLWNNSYRHHVQLANLCVRLDYNSYYSSQFAPPF